MYESQVKTHADAALAILAGDGPTERKDALLGACDRLAQAFDTFDSGLAAWVRGELA